MTAQTNIVVLWSTMIAMAISTSAYAEIEMRPRPTDEKDFPEYIKYLVDVAEPRSAEARAKDAEMQKKYNNSNVVDALFVGAPGFPAGLTSQIYEEAIQHSIDNKYTLVSATVSNGKPDDTPEVVKRRMEETNAYWQQQPERYLQVKSFDDIEEAKQASKLGIIHNFQSMRPLAKDINNVEVFYKLGLRQMNFTYNIDLPDVADGGESNLDGTDEGIHEFGLQVLKEMNRLGIVADCSHSSDNTCIEMAAHSSKPVMMSHSQLMTFQDIPRNVSDKAVKAVAATDGVICVTFIGGFLNAKGEATPYDIAKHVQYIRNLVGPQATCVGPDYVYNYAETLDWILRNPKDFPIESGYATPSHMGKPGEIWGVVRELEDRYNWTKDEIEGFLGENVLRVYKANWK
ncbi:hypothetical protein FE810_10250 [Thalassotalea litorea]|uniref:Dipeptidase n=1 Tax=Thalassotalea litorea TaxID=2020715 RepID=A0A5R9IHR1_9GAMM|nr:membrane dipeptidase [Thalassotalea litorea]TLU64832.1 hypothetical protein FE810_10250 [Thalassotalea litorea]